MACNFTAWFACLTARYQPPPQDPLQSTAIRVLSGRKCDRVSPHKHHPKFVRIACNFTAWLVCLTARYQSPPPPKTHSNSQSQSAFYLAANATGCPHTNTTHPNFVRMACNFTAWLVCLTARYQSSPLPKTHSNPPQSAFYLAANATGCPHTNTTQNLCAWHVILPRGLRVSPLGTSPPPKTHSNPQQSAFYLVANATGCPHTNTTQNLCAWHVILPRGWYVSPLGISPPPPKTHSNPPQSAFYLAANATGCPRTNITQNLCA
jgi:hypothetical protein